MVGVAILAVLAPAELAATVDPMGGVAVGVTTEQDEWAQGCPWPV